MNWCGLDFVTGRAVDNDDTTARHQIISVTDDTLHYTTFYRPIDCKVNFDVADDLASVMCAKTPQSRQEKALIESRYTHFIKNIRPYGKKAAFMTGKVAHALTFDFKFNEKYEKQSFSVRPTLALMTDALTYQQANRKMIQKNPDYELLQCYYFSERNNGNGKKQLDPEKMHFGRVTTNVTRMIQQEVVKLAFEENMDGIFRFEDNNSNAYLNFDEHMEARDLSLDEWAKRYANQYKGVCKFKSRPMRNVHDLEGACMPITASRKGLDYFNIASLSEFMMNGKNPFSEEVPVAMANYYRHMQTWQKIGLV